MSKKSNTTNNLADLRAAIAGLKAEISQASQSGLPLDTCEEALRQSLNEALGLFQQFKSEAAEHIARGEAPTLEALFSYQIRPETIAKLAVGSALAAYGAETFISEAIATAAEIDKANPIKRLSAVDRHDRLLDLRRRLYQAELAEESQILESGEERRHGANPAAVLGLPLHVAEDAGLLGAEV